MTLSLFLFSLCVLLCLSLCLHTIVADTAVSPALGNVRHKLRHMGALKEMWKTAVFCPFVAVCMLGTMLLFMGVVVSSPSHSQEWLPCCDGYGISVRGLCVFGHSWFLPTLNSRSSFSPQNKTDAETDWGGGERREIRERWERERGKGKKEREEGKRERGERESEWESEGARQERDWGTALITSW